MLYKNLMREVRADKKLLKQYRRRLSVLAPFERLNVDCLLNAQKPEIKLNQPSPVTLKHAFEALQCELNKKFPDAILRTRAENEFYNAIRRATRLKFYRSFWMINRNVDLFCPAIASGWDDTRPYDMRGLVIEIDGSIHNCECKMRKDCSKYAALQQAGIGCCVIENGDLHVPAVQNLINNLKNTERLDTRARRRQMKLIQILTLAFYATDAVLVDLYGPHFLDLMARNLALSKGVA